MEVWAAIDDDEKYWVSQLGHVKSYKRYKKGKLLRAAIIKGYFLVRLKINNILKWYSVHRLVAQAFIPNPSNKPEINHINGDRLDNCFINLEWCDRSHNIQHSYAIGTRIGMKGEKNPKAKLKEEDIKEIKRLRVEDKWIYKKIAEKYNVHPKHIQHICREERWTHVS